MNHVKVLADVGQNHVRTVGGKAASLGEMLRADIVVPPGFVVTTHAHKVGMNAPLRQAVARQFALLGSPRVAVRSSAIAEDGANASWAGQLETFLNVTEPELADYIERCWESINTERAQAYASKHNVPRSDRAVAVVVQAMVDSDVAGVMFTAHPLTGGTDQFIIEAAYGLGELVVQGAVVPDTFVVSADNGAVLNYEPHMQQSMLIFADGQNQTVDVPRKLTGKPTLSKDQLQELVLVGRRIAQHYGRPMDIEWAFARGALYILQARPITTI
jgi:pyruvate,water dikinase